MARKLIFFSLVFILIGGGFFYWWTTQKDVRELNKTLPDGIRITKSLIGNDYGVVNKIDGYEFKVPKELHEPESVIYKNIVDDSELGYLSEMNKILQEVIFSEGVLGLQTKEQGVIEVRTFKVSDINLNSFIEKFSYLAFKSYESAKTFEVSPKIEEITTSQVNISKLCGTAKSYYGSEFTLSPTYYFFTKSSNVYLVVHDDDELIKKIILNGKW